MFNFQKGDLFKSSAEVIVNPVNCKGVMGKGLALEFKKRYVNNYQLYVAACKNGSLYPGKLLVCHEEDRTIINFPTKDHWRNKSEMSYIRDGLDSLSVWLFENDIKSIAIPPIGCGNGGLNWYEVRNEIMKKLRENADLVDIQIYGEPPADQDHSETSGSEHQQGEQSAGPYELAMQLIGSKLLYPVTNVKISIVCYLSDLLTEQPHFFVKYQNGKIYPSKGLMKQITRWKKSLYSHSRSLNEESMGIDPETDRLLLAVNQAVRIVNQIGSQADLLEMMKILDQLKPATQHQDPKISPEKPKTVIISPAVRSDKMAQKRLSRILDILQQEKLNYSQFLDTAAYHRLYKAVASTTCQDSDQPYRMNYPAERFANQSDLPVSTDTTLND